MRDSSSRSTAELLENMGWMKGLARSLVVDESSADDLVQDTSVAFLAKPPERSESLRSWIAVVLRNLAKKERRGEHRRKAREAAAARPPEDLTSPDKLLERAELQHRVAEIVLNLPEPCRSTILLRFFDGLKPKEIARRTSVPQSTVSSRIGKGLERIRAELDRTSGGDRKAWCAGLVALAFTAKPVAAFQGGTMKLASVSVVVALVVGVGVWRLCVGSYSKSPVVAAVVETGGGAVADVTLEDLRGNEVSLGDFTKGKVSVVYFWGATCAPCERQAPWLAKLYAELKNKGFTVAAVNAYDDAKETVEAFVGRHGFEVPCFLNGSGAAERLGARVFPTTLLLDRDGNLAETFVGHTVEKEKRLRSRIDALMR